PYLLLCGDSPKRAELRDLPDTRADRRMHPPNFVRDVIMKAPSHDMMNSITRSILQLYSYDQKADDTSIPNVLRQCLNLISQFPMLMVRSEEHTSELSHVSISYAVFCLKKKKHY